MALLKKPVALQSENEILFTMGDTDGSNKLSAVELHDLFASFGEELPLEQWEFAVAYYDQDGDGEINRTEWDAWINAGSLALKPSVSSLLKQ